MDEYVKLIFELNEVKTVFLYLIAFILFRICIVLYRRFDLGNKLLGIVQKFPEWAKGIKRSIFFVAKLALVVIVQFGLVVAYIFSVIGKFFIRSTVFGLIILFGLFAVIFLLSGMVSFNYIALIFYIFDPLSPDDKLVMTVISYITNGIGVLLPISLTLYVFAYREQKASSVSGIYSRNISLLIFLLISIVVIPYGLFLNYFLKSTAVNGNFISTFQHSGRITVWAILVLIALISGAKMLKETIKSVNIRWLLQDLIKEIDDEIFNLQFALTKYQRSTIYPTLHMYVESIYQLFTTAIEKNMNEVYEINYNRWVRLLATLFQSPRLGFIDNTTQYEYLIGKDKIEFQGFYKTILRNHISLIITLVKNNKIEEAHNCLNTFFELTPRSNELNSIYLTGLHELTLLLTDDSSLQIHPILDGIEQIGSDSDFKKGLIFIYKALLVRGVQKNDVKAISSYAYSLSKCIDKEEFSLEQERVNKALDRLTNTIGQNIKLNSFAQVNSRASANSQKNAGVFILLQATLKSIELAHYAATGFLIKFMVTNYDSDIFNYTFKIFCENKGVDNPFIAKREEYSKIYASFSFNDKTLEYCIKKLVILVYGQQNYVKKNKIDFGFVPSSFIDSKLASCSYLEHLFENIQKVGDKYGLNFPIDDELKRTLNDPDENTKNN
ncbi:hypothetical protein [Brevibacillus sp. SIMBA_040]|uniref:hypothetical protein n=2 Tax=Bacillales TaxID=1385 RepID=UPI003979E6CA